MVVYSARNVNVRVLTSCVVAGNYEMAGGMTMHSASTTDVLRCKDDLSFLTVATQQPSQLHH